MVAEKFTVYPWFSDFRERQFYLPRKMANNIICCPSGRFRWKIANEYQKGLGKMP
jgi:hypothetical protein